jgi:hypothetical protein
VSAAHHWTEPTTRPKLNRQREAGANKGGAAGWDFYCACGVSWQNSHLAHCGHCHRFFVNEGTLAKHERRGLMGEPTCVRDLASLHMEALTNVRKFGDLEVYAFARAGKITDPLAVS